MVLLPRAQRALTACRPDLRMCPAFIVIFSPIIDHPVHHPALFPVMFCQFVPAYRCDAVNLMVPVMRNNHPKLVSGGGDMLMKSSHGNSIGCSKTGFLAGASRDVLARDYMS